MLIDVLLVVGDDGLGDGLTDGVNLGGVTTTGDADTDVDTGKLVGTDDEEGLVDLLFHGILGCGVLFFFFFPYPSWRQIFPRLDGEWWRTLKRRTSGWTRERGWPLTLTRPLPCCKEKKSQLSCSLYLCGWVEIRNVGDGGWRVDGIKKDHGCFCFAHVDRPSLRSDFFFLLSTFVSLSFVLLRLFPFFPLFLPKIVGCVHSISDLKFQGHGVDNHRDSNKRRFSHTLQWATAVAR